MNLFTTFASLRKTVASLSLVMLIAGMFATGVATATTSHIFTDVPADAWYGQYVTGLADKGVIDSVSSMYRPGDLVNRAEMAKLSFQVSGLPLEHATAAPFKDVPMGQWYTDYIYTLSKNGIVSGDKANGVPTGWFRPSDQLNRAESVKMMVNSAQMAENLTGAPHFPDVKSADWFYNFVETAFNNGVVAGNPDGTFAPARSINRAEIAKMVYLSMNPVKAGFTLDSAASASLTSVELIYSMNVDQVTAETAANYTVEDSTGAALAVTVAKMTAPDTVLLTVATQTKGKVYYVTAKNVKSAAGDNLANTDSLSFLGYGADVSGGNLTVALSTETPVAGSIPMGATGVVFTCWDFTGGASASVVKSLSVHRVGPGLQSAFDNVYLYNGDNRITTGRTISSSSQTADFSNINQNVAAGANVKICLVGDVALTGSNGGVHAFELLNAAAVTSNSSSMTGSFPLRGADQLITTATVGSSVITKNGSLDDVTIGTVGARVAQFQIAAGATEDQQLNRLALYVRGRATSSAVQNIKLYVEGTATPLATVASVGEKDLATLVLATPFKIGKGQTKIFYVTADITGARNGDDLKVYFDQPTDVYITGLTYGYGTQVDITAYDGGDADGIAGTADDQYSYVLLKGSKFTIAFNGPVAGNLAVNQKQAVCQAMTLTNAAGLDVTIKDWFIDMTAGGPYAGANGYDGLINGQTTVSATDDVANYTNIQLVSLNDDGTISGVLLGSNELSTTGSDTTQNVKLAGTSTIASGQSIKAAIIFDIANNTAAAFADDTIQCVLNAPTGNDQIKDSNNDSLGATNITPSSNISGNTMSIAAAALTFSKNNSPANATQIAKGTSGATLLSFQAKAGSALDTTIKSLTVKADHLTAAATAGAVTLTGGPIMPVTAVAVATGGSGYGSSAAVTFTCTSGGGTSFTIVPTAHTVNTNGVVTSIAMDLGGTGTCTSATASIAAPALATTDIKDLVDSIGVYDSTGKLVSDLKSFPASGAGLNDGTVTFNNLSIPVAKNGTVNLFIKGMVSNSIASSVAVEFALSGTPLIIDSMGQTVTGVSIAAVDGADVLPTATDSLVLYLGTTPTVANTVTAANDPKMFAENQSNPVFAFTLKSTNGNSTLQDMTVNLSTSGTLLPIDSVALYSATSSGACATAVLLKDYESVVASSATAGSVQFTNINKSLADSQNQYICVMLMSKTVVSGQPASNTDIIMGNITFDKVQDLSGSTLVVAPITLGGTRATAGAVTFTAGPIMPITNLMTVATGGTGYTSNPALTFKCTAGSFTVLPVAHGTLAAGVVTGITVDIGGTGTCTAATATIATPGSIIPSIFFKGVPTFTTKALASSVLTGGSEIEVLKFTAGMVGSVSALDQLVVTFESATIVPTSCNMYRGATLMNTIPVVVSHVNEYAFLAANWTNGADTPWNDGVDYTVKCTFPAPASGTSTRAKLDKIGVTGSTYFSSIIWDDSNGATLTDAAFALVDSVLFLNSVEGGMLSTNF